MGAFEHVQSRFRGVLSPRLFGRVETDLYRNGLMECDNWEPLPQGPLRRAPGTSLIGQLTGAPRTIPFRLFNGQDYMVELDDLALHFWHPTKGLLFVGATELVVNGNFSQPNGYGWTKEGTVQPWSFTGGVATFYKWGGVHALTALSEVITLAAPGSLNLSFDSKGLSVAPLVSGLGFMHATLGTTPGGNDLLDVRGYSGTDHVVTSSASTGALAAGTYYLRIYLDSAGDPSAVLEAQLDNVSLTAHAVGASPINIVTPWSTEDLDGIQYVPLTGLQQMVLVHPKYQSQLLTYTDDSTWTLAPIAFANIPLADPTNLGSGPAWTGSNWPGSCEIWQSRLYLGGTPAQRNRMWASRPGALFDFGSSDTVAGTTVVTAACAIDAQLSTKGGIEWLRGRNMLLVGTDLGEGAVTAQSGVVSPLDFQFRPESAFGSAGVMPEDIGDQVLYVSPDRRKLRAVNYSLDAGAWLSHDVTFVAEHVTEGLIKELHFARDPNSTIILVLQDGTLACCTYDRAEQVVAWWTRSTNGGTDRILSAAVTNGPMGSLVYLVVARVTGTYLERMAMSEFAPGRCYCDAAVTLDVSTNLVGDLVAGFAHLAGQTVNLVLDGAVEDNQVVDAGGHISLPRAGSALVVGMPYTSMAKTLPPEHAGPGTTIQRGRTRWTKLFLRLNNSAIPLVAGVRPKPDRTPSTPMDTVEPFITDDVGGAQTDFEDRGRVEIVADLPLRTEVLALWGSLQNNTI